MILKKIHEKLVLCEPVLSKMIPCTLGINPGSTRVDMNQFLLREWADNRPGSGGQFDTHPTLVNSLPRLPSC
jgi:hypothetical protein